MLISSRIKQRLDVDGGMATAAQARLARIIGPAGGKAADGPELLADDRLLIESQKPRRSTFWIPLAVAALLHLAPFLATAFGVASMFEIRRMGEVDGDPNGISVEVVDEASLASLSTPPPPPPPPAQPPSEPPPPSQPAAPPQAQPAPPPQPVSAPQVEPAPPAEPMPPIRGTTTPESLPAEMPSKQPPPETQPDKRPAAKAPPQPTPVDAMVKEMTELFAPSPPSKRPNAKASEQRSPPRDAAPDPATSELDKHTEFQSNSSSFARPADITRSGENDDFGRGVIRSLRQTMPVPFGIRSRVTIKFLLSERGEVVEMQLIKGSGYQLIDQSVVFAARNSTFPTPPKGSKVSDRIFLVTYIYE